MSLLDDTLSRYLKLNPPRPVLDAEIMRIEQAVGLRLPRDFVRVAAVFPGGRIGDVTHYDIAAAAPDSIVERTLALRRSLNLHPSYVVLAEPKQRFVVLAVDENKPSGGLVWSFASYDKRTLAPGIRADAPYDKSRMMMHMSYGEFFQDLVADAEVADERRQIIQDTPLLRPRIVGQLRRRWDESELRRIYEMLRTGRVERRALPSIDAAGKTLVDLRGITLRDVTFGHAEPERRPLLKNIDFSYCRVQDPHGHFAQVRMEDCLFVGADLLQWLSQDFTRCDFTRITLHNGFMAGSFVDCRFVGAALQGAVMGDRFVRCDFSAADLEGAELAGEMVNCTWTACRNGHGFPRRPD
jgi:uncharacterized protein YjbI with pentapeptide repeats